MSNHPNFVREYADAEVQARRLATEARATAAETGVAKSLKAVNGGLGEYLEHALANRFDSIRVNVDGQTLFLKKQVKRTAKAVCVDDLARAFDTLKPGDLRHEREERPHATPIDILATCLIRALEDNTTLYSYSDRIVLETSPLRSKRVVDDSTTDIRVYDAPEQIVELARRQLELKRAKAQLDALVRPKTKRAKELREASKAHLDSILQVVAQEEARGVHVVHTDPTTGARMRLMQHSSVVKAKPVTVPLLNKSGLLKRMVESAVDPEVYGEDPSKYLQQEVRSQLLASFNYQREEYIKENTSTVAAVRVQTLPGARAIQTGRPVPATPTLKARPVAKRAAADPTVRVGVSKGRADPARPVKAVSNAKGRRRPGGAREANDGVDSTTRKRTRTAA